MTATTTTTAPVADQYQEGTNNGMTFSVARYGTLVVTTCDMGSDDEQFATEAQAIEAFADMVEAWWEGPID